MGQSWSRETSLHVRLIKPPAKLATNPTPICSIWEDSLKSTNASPQEALTLGVGVTHAHAPCARKAGGIPRQTVFLGTNSLRQAGVSAGSTMMSAWAVADPTDLQASTPPPLPPHAYQTLSASALGLLKMGLRKPHTCYQLCLKLKTPALAGSAGCSEIPRPQLRG